MIREWDGRPSLEQHELEHNAQQSGELREYLQRNLGAAVFVRVEFRARYARFGWNNLAANDWALEDHDPDETERIASVVQDVVRGLAPKE